MTYKLLSEFQNVLFTPSMFVFKVLHLHLGSSSSKRDDRQRTNVM